MGDGIQPYNLPDAERTGAASKISRKPVRVGKLLALRGNMIRKLQSGAYRLYSRKKDAKSGRRKNLGTFKTRGAAEKHERAVQYFKHSA